MFECLRLGLLVHNQLALNLKGWGCLFRGDLHWMCKVGFPGSGPVCIDSDRLGLPAQDQCAFNGAWGGVRQPKAFYISSYFWDRATDVGIISKEGATTWTVTPKRLSEVGNKACTSPASMLASLFPKVSEALRPFLCMDLAFQHELLIWGFRIPEDREITLVKQIQYGDQLVEAAWPLGAAIDLLST
eukprot:jgi/Botrbrau1/4678/Bobra.33_2s0041.1